MKVLLILISILLSVNGVQAAPWRYNVFPLNVELRYERDSSQQLVDRKPLNLALGVRNGPSTVLMEYSRFNEKTGNTTLSLDRVHEEYLFWWKQNIMNFEICDLFVAGGLGAYTEKVTTDLAGGSSVTDSSGNQLMGGVGAGIQSLVLKYLLVSLEGRMMAGKNFDPNPQPGAVLRLGVEF